MSVAIKIENVSKLYRLGTVGTGTISHDLNRWWHTIRGKEDPYAKVGQVNDRTKKSGKSSVASPQSSANAATANCQLPTDDSQRPDKFGSTEYVWALRDINLEVQQGEILGIIGRNGAGKSTLLKLLSRVTAPTTGSIKTKGRIASLLEVGTGFHPDLTGRENIYMNGAILGMRRHEITRQLDEIVEFSGCAKYLDTPVKRYSSGMTVRLGFAVAAHLKCEILIVDEVLAVGDVEFQQKCLSQMEKVSASGRTVVFVSHNMESVRRLCQQAVVLSNGEMGSVISVEAAVMAYLNQNINGTVRLTSEIPQAEISDGISLKSYELLPEIDGDEFPCRSGTGVTMSLEFSIDREIRGASIQIQVMTGQGIQLHRDASHFQLRSTVNLPPGLVKVACKFTHVPLAAGIYPINVSVVKPAQSYFLKIDSCFDLRVGPNDIFSTGRPPHQPHSIVAMNGDWSMSAGVEVASV